jgi:hypothetical protein
LNTRRLRESACSLLPRQPTIELSRFRAWLRRRSAQQWAKLLVMDALMVILAGSSLLETIGARIIQPGRYMFTTSQSQRRQPSTKRALEYRLKQNRTVNVSLAVVV